MPDRIDFYLGDHLLLTHTETVPNLAGSLSLKHYLADGREEPPAHDAVMTVSYVKAYYNTTTHEAPLLTCHDVQENVCVVPDQHTQPNPKGPKTHFYSPVADDGEAELAAAVPAVSVLAHLPGRYAMPVVSRLPGLGDLPAVAMPPQKTASDPVQTVALLASANGASGRLRQRSCDGS